jgi:hypothetical protein
MVLIYHKDFKLQTSLSLVRWVVRYGIWQHNKGSRCTELSCIGILGISPAYQS